MVEIKRQEKVREIILYCPTLTGKERRAALVEVEEWEARLQGAENAAQEAIARTLAAEAERDELRKQLEKVSPLVTAIHRIATNDGYGEYGDMWLEEINRIAKDALAEWHIKNLRAATPVPKHE